MALSEIPEQSSIDEHASIMNIDISDNLPRNLSIQSIRRQLSIPNVSDPNPEHIGTNK